VPEYWLLDSQEERADFYQLDAAGHYQPVSTDQDGVYQSRTLPNFCCASPWLWQRPLPDTTAVLLRIDHNAYARYLQDTLRLAGPD
jgi:hypothetical protein